MTTPCSAAIHVVTGQMRADHPLEQIRLCTLPVKALPTERPSQPFRHTRHHENVCSDQL